MNKKSEYIGRVIIKTRDQKAFGFDVINETMRLLKILNVDASFEVDNTQKYEMIIEIIDIGSITEKDIDSLFNIFLKNRNDDENFIEVIDKKKRFYLPDDLDECIDWFIVED